MIHIKYGCKDNEKIQGTRINQRKKLPPVEIVLNIVDYHRGKYNCSVPFTGFFFKWNSIYFFPFLGNIVFISYFCSVIKTKNDIYILELKVDDTVDNALAQIDSK